MFLIHEPIESWIKVIVSFKGTEEIFNYLKKQEVAFFKEIFERKENSKKFFSSFYKVKWPLQKKKKKKWTMITSQDGREKSSSKIRMQVRADNGYKIGKLKGN